MTRPGRRIAHVEAHEQGDGDGHRDGERAPRRLGERVDHDQRQHGQQDDHDGEHGDQRGDAADRADLVAGHLARGYLPSRRIEKNSATMSCTAPGEDAPRRRSRSCPAGIPSGPPAPARPAARRRRWRRSGGRTAPGGPSAGSRCRCPAVRPGWPGVSSTLQHASDDEPGVEAVGDGVRPERGHHQPDRRDLLAAGQREDAPGDRADQATAPQISIERGVNRDRDSGSGGGVGLGASGVSVLMTGTPPGPGSWSVGRWCRHRLSSLPPAAPSPRSPYLRSAVLPGCSGLPVRHRGFTAHCRSRASADRVHSVRRRYPVRGRSTTGPRASSGRVRRGGRVERVGDLGARQPPRRSARSPPGTPGSSPTRTNTSGMPDRLAHRAGEGHRHRHQGQRDEEVQAGHPTEQRGRDPPLQQRAPQDHGRRSR